MAEEGGSLIPILAVVERGAKMIEDHGDSRPMVLAKGMETIAAVEGSVLVGPKKIMVGLDGDLFLLACFC